MFTTMAIIGQILVSLALSYLTYLLTRDNNKQKNKPPGKDEYNFPIATENSPVAKIFGRRKLMGFNVLNWNVTRHERIVIKTKSLFGTDKVETPNFKTYVDMHLGFCIADDENAVKLISVLFNDDVVYTNTNAEASDLSFYIDKPDFISEGVGIAGNIDFYSGSDNQVKSSYLNNRLYNGYASRFQKLSYLILKDFYISNSTSAPTPSFILEDIPKAPFLSKSESGWDGKVNPVVPIYFTLINDMYGATLNPQLIDIESFKSVALKLKADDFGIAFIKQSQQSTIDLISEILGTIDGNFYSSLEDGKLKLDLNSSDYDINDLLHIKLKEDILNYSSSRNSISSQFSEVRVKYTSAIDNYDEKFAIYKNPSTRLKKGRQEIKELSYNMITDYKTALKVANREGIPLTNSLFSLSLETNRKLSSHKQGDVILVSIDKLDIYNMPFRITKINYGKTKSSNIKVDLIEDKFGQFKNTFTDVNPNNFIDRSATALNCNLKVLTAPSYFNKNLNIDDNLILTFSEAPNNRHQYFDLLTKSSTVDYIKNGTSSGFSFVGSLNDNIELSDDNFNITSNNFNVVNYQKDDLNAGYNLAVIIDELNNKVEFINFENSFFNTLTNEYEITNINRGLFDTLPKSFNSGSKIYVLSYGYAINNSDYFIDDEIIKIKALTKTSSSSLSFDDASEYNYTVSNRNKRPENINNLKINNVNFKDVNTILNEDLKIDFSYKFKTSSIQYYNDINLNNDDNDVVINIYDNLNNLIKSVILSANETTWTFEDELLINTSRFNYMRVEIHTLKDTLESFEKYDTIINRQ